MKRSFFAGQVKTSCVVLYIPNSHSLWGFSRPADPTCEKAVRTRYIRYIPKPHRVSQTLLYIVFLKPHSSRLVLYSLHLRNIKADAGRNNCLKLSMNKTRTYFAILKRRYRRYDRCTWYYECMLDACTRTFIVKWNYLLLINAIIRFLSCLHKDESTQVQSFRMEAWSKGNVLLNSFIE